MTASVGRIAKRHGRLRSEAARSHSGSLGMGSTVIEQRRSNPTGTAVSGTVGENDRLGHDGGAVAQQAAVFRRDSARSSSLVAALSRAGIDASGIAGADALRELVEAKRIKVLIVDNQIGGFFTGMEVIRKLRTGLNWVPAIVLDEDKQRLASDAKAAGGVTVLDCTATDEEIVKAAQRLFARQARAEELTPFQAKSIVDRVGDLPVLSQLTITLLRYQEMETQSVPV